MNNFTKLLMAVGVAEAAGVVGAFFTTPAISSGWYAELVKPALNPPSWVFGPVWTTLYALMGISVFLVYEKNEKTILNEIEEQRLKTKKKIALILFGIQLFLNAIWSVLFFGLHSPGGALIEIIFLWLAILATIVAFARISKSAAWLLAPYIVWVSFALYLNLAIWAFN